MKKYFNYKISALCIISLWIIQSRSLSAFCQPVADSSLPDTLITRRSPANANDEVKKSNEAARLNNESIKLCQEGKLQEARLDLEAACSLDPTRISALVHANLGALLLELGEIDAGRTEFTKALNFNPNTPDALFGMGNSYFQQRNPNQAKHYLDEYIKKYPNERLADNAHKLLNSLKNMTEVNDVPTDSDYYRTAVIGRITRWSIAKQPIKVFIESGAGIDGYSPSFNDDLCQAFNKWIEACHRRLSWELTTKKGKADIVCHWSSDKKHFRYRDGAELGETRIKSIIGKGSPDQSIIKSIDMNLCTKDNDGATLTDAQMLYLCLHEVGHALGIKNHSSNPNDIMYFLMRRQNPHDLTFRDKTTLLHLYSQLR
jgi:predicted Zn-dependent protease